MDDFLGVRTTGHLLQIYCPARTKGHNVVILRRSRSQLRVRPCKDVGLNLSRHIAWNRKESHLKARNPTHEGVYDREGIWWVN